MPRSPAPRLTTSLVRRSAACVALGISARTFDRHWAAVFTDPRTPEDRRPRVGRKVYEDELAVAVDAGGDHAGRIAVLNYRGTIGRTA
jgi:hypothetical protein